MTASPATLKKTPARFLMQLIAASLCSCVGAQESEETWYASGQAAVARNMDLRAASSGTARNVILFVGDGMGVSTVTAARIMEGQLLGGTGEEHMLSFEQFPNLAL